MSDVNSGVSTPKLSNATYDRLKFPAQVVLPGVGALYFALAQIWGLPKAEEIVGTITAIDVFLGLFLVKASSAYSAGDDWYDGYVPAESLPDELADRDAVVMKVHRSDEF